MLQQAQTRPMCRRHVAQAFGCIAALQSESSFVMDSFSPDDTRDGELPPFEIAKAYAFKMVLERVAATLRRPASKLLGEPVAEYIASQLTVKGGGAPASRTVQQVLSRCQDPSWYPGKPSEQRSTAGRKPIYSEHSKNEVARVGMDFKRNLQIPSPRRVRQRLS